MGNFFLAFVFKELGAMYSRWGSGSYCVCVCVYTYMYKDACVHAYINYTHKYTCMEILYEYVIML